MKLLLTSAGWEENKEIGKELMKLVGMPMSKVKVFVVMTPDKHYKRNKYVMRALKIGIPQKNVTFFQLDRKIKSGDLKEQDIIFVFGGNTFDYLDRIRKTGLDKEIRSFVDSRKVYVGFSAGSYVACPNIKHALWKHADNNRLGLKNLKGLGLAPFIVVAHFEKKFKIAIEKSAKETKLPVFALTDKQAISVNGEKIKFIGGKVKAFNI